ncbi:hypothetical protein EDD85DRAFT_837643 [Armillaria nabsnona]|nr:hypothetical protein EDD85DRAFT_837643 [Armillaria nabsnona]
MVGWPIIAVLYGCSSFVDSLCVPRFLTQCYSHRCGKSVRSLVSKGNDELKDFHIPSIIAVVHALSKAFTSNIAWFSSEIHVQVSSYCFLSDATHSEHQS